MTAKEKKAEYDKKRKLEKKEEISEKSKIYYQKNKIKILERERIYRELNKDRINTRKKELRHLKRLENPTDEYIKASYNITLAERYKQIWINEELYFYNLKLIEEDGTIFYKYGLTKNIKNRLWKIPYKVEILELALMNKYDAIWLEYNSLKNVNRYVPQKIFKGYTECFN